MAVKIARTVAPIPITANAVRRPSCSRTSTLPLLETERDGLVSGITPEDRVPGEAHSLRTTFFW